MEFAQIERNPLYRQVAEQIREIILAGGLAPGQNLPTERELSDQFGVSRASIREALRALEAQGLVSTNPNSGSRTVVAEVSSGPLIEAMVHMVRLRQVSLEDLVDLRCVLEDSAVRRAARRDVAEELDGARDALAVMLDRTVSVEDFDAADVRFHIGLALASGSEAVHLMMLAVRETIARHLLAALRSLPDPTAGLPKLARQHQAILRAVESGDGDRAAELMRAHILGFYRDFMPADRANASTPTATS